MLQHVSALTFGHFQGAPKFLACADNASTYVVGVLHMIKIFIILLNIILVIVTLC